MIGQINGVNINTGNSTNFESKINFNPEIKNAVEDKTSVGQSKKEVNELNKSEECKTCSERKYKDGSDDGGVSFQSATKLSPAQAGSAVAGHEREHFRREQTEAKNEGKEVVSNRIQIHNAICPECGKMYVSGGTTRTVTKEETETSQKALDKNDVKGINFDKHV